MNQNEQPIPGAEHRVTHGDVHLFVWEKFQGRAEGKPVVVLAHGSATGGRESFDLQVPDVPDTSLIDFLARAGFDVFALDVRGFGRSTRPDEGVSTEQAAADLNAVVDHVLALRGVTQVHLLGWSWGTQYGGQFLMQQGHKVARYVSYAQQHPESPDLAARRHRLPTFQRAPYLRISERGWKMRFDSMTPPEVNDVRIVDAFARIAAEVETKSPTGPHVDLLMRQPLIDATKITVPTLLIHGQYDDVSDLPGLLPFFVALSNLDKQYTVIPGGGHMLHLQQGRKDFQRAVAAWFARG